MSKKTKLILQGIGFIAIIALAFSLAGLVSDNESVRMMVFNYGYIGAFVISIVSGFNLLVPIPAVSFMPLFIESGISFLPAILVITLGVTLADIFVCVLAMLSKHLAKHASIGDKIFEKFHEFGVAYPRSPLIILFFYASLIPLPNELLLIPLILARHSLRQIILVILIGNFIHQFLYAKGVIGIFNIF